MSLILVVKSKETKNLKKWIVTEKLEVTEITEVDISDPNYNKILANCIKEGDNVLVYASAILPFLHFLESVKCNCQSCSFILDSKNSIEELKTKIVWDSITDKSRFFYTYSFIEGVGEKYLANMLKTDFVIIKPNKNWQQLVKYIKINLADLHNISELAMQNARDYITSAELLSAGNLYSQAYVCLTLAIEEASKSKICMVYSGWRTHRKNYYCGKSPFALRIKIESVSKCFEDHDKKRLTWLTQSIMELMNTFDRDYRAEISQNIQIGIPTNKDVLYNLYVFNKMNRIRNNALYVNLSATYDIISLEDYEELYKIAKPFITEKNTNSFIGNKGSRWYEDLEELVYNLSANFNKMNNK